jgi:N-acetylmuramic acid 6-phosphate etherase
MIKTGKVYENMMVNLKPSNMKLKARVVNIVSEIRSCDTKTAAALLEQNEWNIKKAVTAQL